jgi:hypothetical protein
MLFTSHNIPHITLGNEQCCLKLLLGVCNIFLYLCVGPYTTAFICKKNLAKIYLSFYLLVILVLSFQLISQGFI